ncbi:MAG: hypothetical protein K2I33_04710, partial [Oscillospiraceae bacterium]|nr:hypothetical protein [Oscillospiraceae bacterium]
MSSKQKILSAILFVAMIVIMPVIFIFSKKSSYSAEENRMLSKMPKLNASAVSDKSYMHDLEKYLSDHFPDRLKWVQAKMSLDRFTGKDIINGIYITDDMLIEKLHVPDYEEVKRSVQAINAFADHYKTDVFAMIVPTSAGIYQDMLPEFAPQLDQRKFISDTCENFSENVNVIDIVNTMICEKDNYIYYRNDHHWTSYGAYCAYKISIQKLGYTAVKLDKFDIEHASSNFKGTFYSKCLYDKTAADVIDIFSCKNGAEVTDVICNDGVSETYYDSVYFMDYLEKNDKYCVFLGENRAYTNIKTNVDNGKKILVIKDSYANSFIPFLTQHYSEIA